MVELGLILAISVLGLAFAGYLITWVMARDTGTPAMREVSDAIKAGAEAFLRRQNKTIAIMAAGLACLIFIVYGFVRQHEAFDPTETSLELAFWTTLSFVLGAMCSVAAGYVGMWISIRTNVRAAAGARTSLNDALQVALRGGAVSGLFVVAMSLLGVAGLFGIIFAAKGGFAAGADSGSSMIAAQIAPKIPLMIAGYGFGASFVALFAQVGGGIYTKAADVGADLVGKVEAGIPEDDPRNPAVIADLVGDNVGDCAGRGADLFESTAAENIGAMIIAATLYQSNAGKLGTNVLGIMLFPLVARAFGIVASIFGVMFVKTDGKEDPMHALNRGFYVTAFLASAGFGGASIWLLGEYWVNFFLCGLLGIVTSLLFVFITQYYTEYRFKPVQDIAEASIAGPATNIIQGIAVGLECVWMPVIVISGAILGSYKLGDSSGLTHAGLFGTAVATMGMLGTAGYILAMDTFGPITDNAGGIVEMSIGHDQPEVREKTDKLDSVGNTTKALTKGYAVGSAALAAFLLFSAYIDEINHYTEGRHSLTAVNLNKPAVFVGALLGAMLVFWFSALCIKAVGRSAQKVIEEVRRQFKSLPRENGIIVFPAGYKPDYGTCVDIVTKDALRQMVAPGLLAVGMPIGVGLLLRALKTPDDPLLAAEGVAALLMVGTIAGILMALFLNNAGGAWDNAKKYIETGAHGGKYLTAPDGTKTKNPVHAAAVVGDTVGDPFKDTAGPSLHVLIKMLSTITLVLAPLFL
jgi:K(+)-stimulated pyrophosphate-energized sodium pump